MPPYTIRLFGDPVLKQKAAEITDVDGNLARLADGLAAVARPPGSRVRVEVDPSRI